uniref:[RNA-polymerase]-subunit kinase n=1 Tax=Leersia perrieri TaxID=77586 RepID=A0A0D9VF71_9ORYZ
MSPSRSSFLHHLLFPNHHGRRRRRRHDGAMGCAQGKPSRGSPARSDGRGIDHLMRHNRYVPASASTSRLSDPLPAARHLLHVQEQQHDTAKTAERPNVDDRRETTTEKAAGDDSDPAAAQPSRPPQPVPVRAPRREEELVDGWPTWLLDNVPREALQGIVPKSADAYDKIAKARHRYRSITVGQGTYSNVYKARERGTGRVVALKKVRFDTSESESVRFMAREMTILRRLDHPNVIRLEGIATSRMHRSIYLVFDFMYSDLTRLICRPHTRLTEPQVTNSSLIHTSSFPVSVRLVARRPPSATCTARPSRRRSSLTTQIVSPWIRRLVRLRFVAMRVMFCCLFCCFRFFNGGMPSLRKVTKRKALLCPAAGLIVHRWVQIKCYMQQLLSGLQHCHERGILHRDIKGSNLLIDRHGVLKIGDFGLANYYGPGSRRPLTSRVVTLWYRAPELLLGSTDYGVGIDLWSAGCLLAELFSAKPLMPGRTEIEQLSRIFSLCGSPPDDYWRKMKLPSSFRPPKTYRPSMMDKISFMPPSALTLLTTLLALDPAARGTAAQALESSFFSTPPLPCDISTLPVVYKEEDEVADPVASHDGRKPKLRDRSQKRRDSKKKSEEQHADKGHDLNVNSPNREEKIMEDTTKSDQESKRFSDGLDQEVLLEGSTSPQDQQVPSTNTYHPDSDHRALFVLGEKDERTGSNYGSPEIRSASLSENGTLQREDLPKQIIVDHV